MQVADQAVLGDRQVAADHVLERAGHGRPGTGARSAACSCDGDQRRAEHARLTPWRASRIFVVVPTPGTTCRRAARSAGLQQQLAGARDAAADHDLAGSNVLIALAIPIPSRSPRMRRQSRAGASPS